MPYHHKSKRPHFRGRRVEHKPEPALGSPENILRGIKRDLILEHDDTYIANAKAINERYRQRKIDTVQRGNIFQWQVFAALRRAHLTLTEARQLAFA